MDDKLIQDKELVNQQECPVNRVHKLDKELMRLPIELHCQNCIMKEHVKINFISLKRLEKEDFWMNTSFWIMSNEEGKHPKVDSNRKSPYILNGH